MFKKLILISVIFLPMCSIAQNIKIQQDSCSYMNPIFVKELSKMFRNPPPVADDYYKPFFLLRFFNLDSNLYFTMGYCPTFPPAIEVQDAMIEIDTNCIYYYLINGYNILISDYCSSIGHGLYFPCQKTNQQALMEKSTSPPYIFMGKGNPYWQTYQVLQDSIIQVPLIIPVKYAEDKEIRLRIISESKYRRINKIKSTDFWTEKRKNKQKR